MTNVAECSRRSCWRRSCWRRFAAVETRLARSPLVPFAIFRSRRLAAGDLLSFLSVMPVMATWFFLTLYLQRVRGASPLEAGLAFLPMALMVVGGSQAGFRVIRRVDARAGGTPPPRSSARSSCRGG